MTKKIMPMEVCLRRYQTSHGDVHKHDERCYHARNEPGIRRMDNDNYSVVEKHQTNEELPLMSATPSPDRGTEEGPGT